MKIIVDNCMFYNGGDAAINLATIQILQDFFPGAEISFADAGFPQICKYYPAQTILPQASFLMDQSPVIRWSRRFLGNGRRHFAFRKFYFAANVAAAKFLSQLGLPLPSATTRAIAPYLDADLVLAAGGTYLVSKYDYTHRILEFQKNVQLGRRMALFTHSLEPFADDFQTREMIPLFKRMKLVLLRHKFSVESLRSTVGNADNAATVADSVFTFWQAGPHDMAGRRARTGRKLDAPLKIAVSVRQLKSFGKRPKAEGHSLYRDSVRNAVIRLVREKGAEVTFLSTCQGIPEYWSDDSAVAVDFTKDLPEDVAAKVTVDRSFNDPHQLMEKIRGFDGVIASRLHMAILTICTNTPVLPVSYEPKFGETFAELGLPDLITLVEDIAPQSFGDKTMDWVARLDKFSAILAANAPKMQKSAHSAGQKLKDALANAEA